MTAYVCLTLVADREIQQDLFDYLSEQAPLVAGYTASEAEGHGSTARLHSIAEQVKGRANRVLIRMILDEQVADQLIQQIMRVFAGTHIVYWTTPTLQFGVT
jgi:hypothetical protein